MKRTILSLTFLVAVLAACTPSAERQDNTRVQDQQAHYATTQPVPFFDYSLDRDVLIQIYESKNEARQTSTVIESFSGELLFSCPSIGYGIAADVQITNPLAPFRHSTESWSEGVTVEQPEPNGLFSSKNTDATYVLCVRDNGDVAPIYTEEKVTVFPFAITIGEDGVIQDVGDDSSITVDLETEAP